MMKKSTWKKLFTRSKSKSATRAAKKGKATTAACNVCAGIAVINVDTLCSTHKNSQNKNQAAVTPQVPEPTSHSIQAPQSQGSNQAPIPEVSETPEPVAAAAALSVPREDRVSEEGEIENRGPVEASKPQPLARTSTNEEFMTEEVDSHNLSDNSRTEETLETVNEAQEENVGSPSPVELKTSGAQEHPVLKNSSETEEMRNPSEIRSLRIRRSGTQEREVASDSKDFKVLSQTLQNQISFEPSESHSLPIQRDIRILSSTTSERGIEGLSTLNEGLVVEIPPVETQEDHSVEAKNRKNVWSALEVDVDSIARGISVQPRRGIQRSGKQVETTLSNNEEFTSEEVAIGIGNGAEREETYPKSSRRVSSAIMIPNGASSSSHHESNVTSDQGLQIVEVDKQGRAAPGSRRLSMDATNISMFGGNRSPTLIDNISKESSEDLKPGVLQAQRSSKLNISFSEHISLMGATMGIDQDIKKNDSSESSEKATDVTIIETTTIIATETSDGPLRLGMPSFAQKTSSDTESEEVLLPPPEDEDPTLDADSGMGSDESSSSGPKETTEETSIQQDTATNARPSPTIIFGSLSAPEPENEWSQPLFFGPNSHRLSLNMNRERENAQGSEPQTPFQGFGIISIMRDLYENDSSASQVQENRVTEILEEKKKDEDTEETGESAQAPPSLEDDEAEQESFKEVAKKKE